MENENGMKSIIKLLKLWLVDIILNNAVGYYDINKISENLALKLLNEIYDYNLTNLNIKNPYHPAIDLGDKEKGIAFQITSRNDKEKIEDTLKKFVKYGFDKEYSNGIRFLILNQDVKKLREINYQKFYPKFNNSRDIISDKELIRKIDEIYVSDGKKFERIKNLLESKVVGKTHDKKSKIAGSPTIDEEMTKKVFYEGYSIENEPFYLERKYDKPFRYNIKFRSMWISGERGVGKTDLIERNLIKENIDYYKYYWNEHCGVDFLFKDMLDELTEKYYNDKLVVKEDSIYKERNLRKQIFNLLDGFPNEIRIYICLDDLYLEEEDYKPYRENIEKLVTYYYNKSENKKVKFIISTSWDPTKYYQGDHKAIGSFKFMNLAKWSYDELNKLLNIWKKGLNIDYFSTDLTNEIISSCNGYPGVLKDLVQDKIL